MQFTCLWDGATASNAQIRKNLIESCCDNYIRRKVDGIFFSPLERVSDTDVINKNICHKISQAKIPLILIDRDIVPPPQKSPFDVVCLDNYGAGCVMAQHLIDAGCKNLFPIQAQLCLLCQSTLPGCKEYRSGTRLALRPAA